jgi:hypothetical protein
MKKALIALSLTFATIANAWTVFDPTNWIQTSKSALHTLNSYNEQLDHYGKIERQAKALSRGDLSALSVLTGDQSMITSLNDFRNMQRAIGMLDGGINSQLEAVNFSLKMAEKYNITYDEYVERQKGLAERGVNQAKRDKEDNIRKAKDVENAYEQVKLYSSKMPETQTALLQQLSSQMNALITLNTKQLEMWIRDNNMKATITEQDSANNKGEIEDEKTFLKKQSELIKKQRAAMQEQLK